MKLLPALLLACLATPVVASAQQPPSSTHQPQANPITQTAMGFGYFGGWLIAAFDSIPESQYGFRPTPVQQTVGFIAQHLENANLRLCSRFSGLPYEVTAKDSLADTLKARWPKDTLVARLTRSLVYCRDAMGTLTDARLAEELPAADTWRKAPRARFVFLLLTDLAEHYSQVASYMRLLGMVPPSALQTQTKKP